LSPHVAPLQALSSRYSSRNRASPGDTRRFDSRPHLIQVTAQAVLQLSDIDTLHGNSCPTWQSDYRYYSGQRRGSKSSRSWGGIHPHFAHHILTAKMRSATLAPWLSPILTSSRARSTCSSSRR